MAQVFGGSVKYGPPKREEKPWGVQYSLAIDPDNTSAPKLYNGALYVNLKEGTKALSYANDLAKGDRVTVVYQDKGDKSYYELVVPTVSEPSQPTQLPQRTATTPPSRDRGVYSPLVDDDIFAFSSVVGDVTKLLQVCWRHIDATFPDLDNETKQKLAVTAFINADRVFKPGMRVEVVVDDAAFISSVKESDAKSVPQKVLHAISSTLENVPAERVAEILKSFGLSSADIAEKDEDSWLRAWYITKAYTELRGAGSSHLSAIDQVCEAYGLELPELDPF
jgi:hypothetical protein